MSKKIITIIIITNLITISAGVYGGMEYSESKNAGNGSKLGNFQNFQNLSPEERQQRLEELGANPDVAFRGARNGNGIGPNSITGEIIAKDEQSITVKLPDGGSKIIFFSEATDITKSVSGSLDDLKNDEQIIASGQENSDGTYTAKTIQILPSH